MLTEAEVIALLNPVTDPFLHRTLEETGGIVSVRVRAEAHHVSVKLAVGKPQSTEQMALQQQVVQILKRNGASTVGLRFEALPDATIAQLQQTSEQKAKPTLLKGGAQPHFITIASGKGGVGKSTVTVNLAMALTRLGKKVGIIDADIYGFSIPDMMGIEDKPVLRDEKLIPVDRFGIKVISMGFFVEENAPIIWRGPMLGKMIHSFFQEVDWGELDYLLLDLPPGTGDIAMDIHGLLPVCNEIIVTTPHQTAALVAARAGQMALKTNHRILGVIENMAYFESKLTGEREYVFGRGGGDTLASELDTDVLGRLPLAQPDDEAGAVAPSIYQERHPLSKQYEAIARNVITHLEK